MKFQRIRNALMILFVASAGGFTAFEFFNSDLVRLSEIRMEGVSPDHRERLLSRLHVKKGDPFWKLSLEREVDGLQRDAWVHTVEMQRELPTTLAIHVVEKKPVAVVGDKRGHFAFIDQRSDVIDEASVEKAAGYPLLMGENLWKDRILRQSTLSLLSELPDEGILSKKDVSHLEYDVQRGFSMTLQRTGLQIFLGHDQFPLKVDRARRVVLYLNQHGLEAKKLDADFSKKVVVQTK